MSSAKRYIKKLFGLDRPAAQPRNKPLWSIGIYSGTSPLSLGPDSALPVPAITREHVTDVPAAFVADPFLVRSGDAWHLFFEVLNRRNWRGEIGVATSTDLTAWTYGRIVLAEPFHISYPHVFEWQGAHYMVPETHKTRTVRLYKADPFPTQWTLVHTLLTGHAFSDSTLFRHQDRWWMFTETSAQKRQDMLRLYYADDLFGTWTEHPASPIVTDNAHTARPAGRVVATSGGLLRYAQDCAPKYGLSVHAFEITDLTPTSYVERPASPAPILTGSTTGWNADGMHHADVHCVESGRWIAAVDGWSAVTPANLAGER